MDRCSLLVDRCWLLAHSHYTMLESKAKIKAENFLRHVQLLAQNSPNRIIEGFRGTESESMKQFTNDSLDLIEHGEWGIGLENLLTNIYEIEFAIDKKAVELAKDAIEEYGMNYTGWTFI